jgi:putative transposase
VRAAAKVPARNHRDSRHGLPIYPNLAAGMVLTSIDQLWVADITYIHL